MTRERAEFAAEPGELAAIYEGRGVAPDLAAEVAAHMIAHDALGAHARDELGLTAFGAARPVQAAVTSALTFSASAAAPLLVAVVCPAAAVAPVIMVAALLALAGLGALGARVGMSRL